MMIVSYVNLGALLLLALSSVISPSDANNPCAGLPLCKLKKDASKGGSLSSSPASPSSTPRIRSFLRRPRPSLSRGSTTTTTPSAELPVDEIEPSSTTTTERSFRSRFRNSGGFKSRSQGRISESDDSPDGCQGLPLCVLSKNSSSSRSNKNVPTATSTTTTEPPLFQDNFFTFSESLSKKVLNGHTDEALALIDNGADVNEEDVHGNTVLHIAAQNGRTEVIRPILLGGADVNAENNHKNTPLQLAAQNGWTEIVEIMLSAKKIEINKFDLHKNTALHLAAQNGQIGVAEALLEAEAKVNPVNSHKQIPLHLSAQNGHLALSALLVDYGGNYNYKDLIGNTPLHTAVHTTHIQIANMFIKAGADAKIKNLTGLTAFQLRG